MVDPFQVDSSFLNWTKVFIIMRAVWGYIYFLFSIKHKKDTWCQPPVWQHSLQMSPSTWQSDLTSHQMMSCQWKRRGKEQRPPAPDRTEREKKDIVRPQIYISTYIYLFHYPNSYFTLTGNRWSNLREAFSPQSHSCRRKKSTLPLSLSFTGQYTTLVSIPSTTKHAFAKELLHFLFTFTL